MRSPFDNNDKKMVKIEKHHDHCPPAPSKKIKVLFVLRDRSNYGMTGVSYGLKNSVFLITKALEKYNIEFKIVETPDTNFVDKELYLFRPDFVIIEALWLLPNRLPIFFKLHPYIKKWSIRLHSRTPFLSNEGSAIDYIKQYHEMSKINPNFNISVNHTEMVKELRYSLGFKPDYLPNIYPFEETCYTKDKHPDILDISSFGSIRPQKNILIQAMAAIRFADKCGKKLRFHVNDTRNEQRGENTLKNLIALFEGSKHTLIRHPWLNHSDFCQLVKTMDISMGVSNTESFCITIMDAIANNVPVVVSDVIEIVSPIFRANPNEIDDIVDKLDNAYSTSFIHLQALNKQNLKKFNEKAIKEWLGWLDYKD